VKVYANDQRKITCGEFSKSVCSLSSGHNLFLLFSFTCTLYVLKNDWVSELHFFLSCQYERRIMSWCRRVSFGLLDMSQYLSNSYLCRS